MIAAFAMLILAIALGCAALEPVYRSVAARDRAPRWAALLFAAGAGMMFGLGATSILYFLAVLLVPRFPLADPIVEVAALAWLVYRIIRRKQSESKPDEARIALNLSVAGALAVTLILATWAMSKTWDVNSQGGWDAWSIWNLRAKFLAVPELAARAWSPLLANTHPEYPLLLSAAVARGWAFSGGASSLSLDAVPIAIAYLFFLALIAAVTGGMAIVRGAAAGLVAGVTLAATAALLHEVPSQYADVPVAAYMACAALFLLMDHPAGAGVFAGFAAWTKDEGAFFCAALVALIAIFRRRDAPRVMLGMVPGALIVAGFKLFLAPHVTSQFAAGTLTRFANTGRWGVVLGGVAGQIVSLGGGWFHPVYILIAYAIGVRFRSDSSRDAYLLTALGAVLLAGYSMAMVTQPNDVLWQTNTAAGRLVVQWWPLAVIAMMLWLRRDEEWAFVPALAKKKHK